jgi:triphosphoribosyl-dephospho-CoA synthase
MNPEYIAQCACLAMALEVSATPKPGNVDREHDYQDTRYEHFLASAFAVYPVIREAAAQKKSFGALLKKAVEESNRWQQGGNTHFGALLLLIPLAMAEGSIAEAEDIVKHTTVADAICFYQAFKHARVRVPQVEELSLQDEGAIAQIKQENRTLYQLMEIAEDYDEVAREWTQGFPLTQQAHRLLLHHTRRGCCINQAIVQSFLEILKEHPDTFIQTKHGRQTALRTSEQAALLVERIGKHGYASTVQEIKAFDEALVAEKINPGSTADIIIAGLFLLLLGGYRF